MNKLTGLTLLVLLLVAGCKPKTVPAARLFQSGLDSAAAGNHSAAIRIYSALIKKDPRLQQPYLNRAIAYHTMKDYEQALSDLDRLVKMLNKDGVILSRNSNVLGNDQVDWTVDYKDVIYLRAITKADMDSLTVAYKDFQYLVDNKYQDISNCYLWQGVLLGRSGNDEKACEQLDMARRTAKSEDAYKEAMEMLKKNCPGWADSINSLKY